MHIKVDYSKDCKSHDYNVHRGGSYAIYTKKHWWNKWIEGSCYADLNWAIHDAEKMARLPKIIR